MLRSALTEACVAATQAVGDDAVVALAQRCPRLRSLSLYWNVRVTDAAVRALVAQGLELDTLNLSGCKGLVRPPLSALSLSLTSLDLTRCLGLTDATLQSLGGCAKLRSLRLYSNSQHGGPALAKALAPLHLLEEVDLCGLSKLEDAHLGALQPSRLRWLNLTWCPQLTDASLVPLLLRAPTLEWLSLHGNTHVTDAVIHALQSACSATLHTLDVKGCTAMEQATRAPQALKARLPRLHVFAVHG